jgi:SAM-dependent methyltransferase
MGAIDRREGQRAFGSDPDGYHGARPAYPERIFEILRQRCGLRAPCRTFEIGGGTGLCTRRLLELGASPLVVVEPDERLACFLTRTLPAVDVRVATFESASLLSEWFDLGTSASAFHWLDEASSLSKIGQILRDGGWWAVWWNLFFDGSRIDEFHKATRILLECLDRSPSYGLSGRPSFAMDTGARIANMRAVGGFEHIEFEDLQWSVTLDSLQVMRLYATFSPISRLHFEERNRLLYELGQVAEKQFWGRVELYITTPIYTAQRQVRK